MELFEAIKTRKSIRAYKPEPIPMETLTDLLNVALRSPSGVNSQPWEFFIVKGEALDELGRACVKRFNERAEPAPDLPIADKKHGETGLKGIYWERQVTVAKQLFQSLGIAKGDVKGVQAHAESMYRFYDAPALIIIVMDEFLKPTWPVMDIGIISQTIALAALEYGLGTCIMRAAVDFPETVRKVVGIPQAKKLMVGLTIGFPDWDHPLNRLVSEREKLENLLTVVE